MKKRNNSKVDDYIITLKEALVQYKKGEITKKEFNAIRDDVGRSYQNDQIKELEESSKELGEELDLIVRLVGL